MSPAVPSWWGVGASVLLVVLTVALVVREQLGLTRDVVLASVRAIVQLVAVGALLGVLFDHAGLPGAVAWVVAMVTVGGRVSGRRGAGVPGAQWISAVSIGAGTAVTLGLLVAAQVIDDHPRVLVPVGGMVVSAATRGTSVALLRMAEEAVSGRRQVEARLALGLPGAAAFAPHRRSAMRAALVTDIDAVRTVGLISLPGAMTGLLLAGVDPLVAIRYQVVVMWMILTAVTVSTAVAARLGVGRLFDSAQRLLVADGA